MFYLRGFAKLKKSEITLEVVGGSGSHWGGVGKSSQNCPTLIFWGSIPCVFFRHLYINLRRSCDCRLLWLCVGGCLGFIVSYALHLLILGSCYIAHKRIVNIMKVYIKKNNIQVELIRFRKK